MKATWSLLVALALSPAVALAADPAAPHAAVAAPPRPAEAHPVTAATPPPAAGPSARLRGSKHDFSTSGPGPIKATTESDMCRFCHASHGKTGGASRPDPGASKYRAYTSSTLNAPAGAPARSTRTCLSCHDGTIAVGQTLRGRIAMVGGKDTLAPNHAANIGTDLRRTHPVSTRLTAGPKLRRPNHDDPIRIDQSGGAVECTSCHDPHREDRDPVQRRFLVKSNRESTLCLSCHVLEGWEANPSAHRASTRPLGLTPVKTPYSTVSDAGCGACHQSHGASADRGRLLADETSEDTTCLKCHNGLLGADIARDTRKPVAHAAPTGRASGHDGGEGPSAVGHRLPEDSAATARHATCVDCHNPHAAFKLDAQAPAASGALAGVWGIDRNGVRVERVRYEYEVCFKCHGDSANQPQARGPVGAEKLRRQVVDVNLRRAFDLSAPSFHPVEGPGRGAQVPSLVPSLKVTSVIYCSDCHASETAAAGGPRGPHGSSFTHLLERNLTTVDNTAENPTAYALCYKCHVRDVLLATGATSQTSTFLGKPRDQNDSGNLHYRHVSQQSTPCTACHASHGVSTTQGNPVNNAHLVDFDVSIVKPNAQGALRYTSNGPASGSCAVSCHGYEHDGLTKGLYSPVANALRLRAAGPTHRAVAAPPRRP
jgi:predicted CXXCH cytochrome family protein